MSRMMWTIYFVPVGEGVLLFVVSHVQRTKETTYTASQLNLAKLTKEPSATYYQIRLWSQRGTKVNRPHHGDIHPAAFTTMMVRNRDKKSARQL